jgi:hypothetical protein
MTDVDLDVGSQDGREPHHRAHESPPTMIAHPADSAAWAAEVTAQQAMSVLDAVVARAAEVDAHARREAVGLRLRTRAATAGALGRLDAIDAELEALALEIRRRTDTRSTTRDHAR